MPFARADEALATGSLEVELLERLAVPHTGGDLAKLVVGGVYALDLLKVPHGGREGYEHVGRQVHANQRLKLVKVLRDGLETVVLELRGGRVRRKAAERQAVKVEVGAQRLAGERGQSGLRRRGFTWRILSLGIRQTASGSFFSAFPDRSRSTMFLRS